MKNNIKFRYIYKRKSDNHIYQIIYSLQSIERGTEGFSDMLNNDLWEIIGINRYTGLKDKNNNEIYENDILLNSSWHNEKEYYSFIQGGKGVIKYRKGEFIIECPKYKKGKMNKLNIIHNNKNTKIVGNIYNEPELLEN